MVYPLKEFVVASSIVMRRFGWAPKVTAGDSGDSTAAKTIRLLRPASNPMEAMEKEKWVDQHKLTATAEDFERAAESIAWAKTVDGQNRYMKKLRQIAQCGEVTNLETGYAASLITACRKNRKWEAVQQKSANPSSQHIGDLGGRYKFNNLVVQTIQRIPQAWADKFLVHFADVDGNVLVWWAHTEPDWLAAGDTVTVAATVKKHTEFRGTKQTRLNRVTLIIPKSLGTPCETCDYQTTE